MWRELILVDEKKKIDWRLAKKPLKFGRRNFRRILAVFEQIRQRLFP